MPRLDLKEWAKTPDGIEHIQGQKPFCVGGVLWQGYKGAAIRADESTMETEELQVVPDIDETMHEIWLKRRQRLEGRLQRKMDEYDKRRSLLRKERSDIRASMKEDKELGLGIAPDDIDQVKRINKRMERLVDLNKELDLEAALVGEKIPVTASDDDETVEVPPVEVCPVCEKESPPGNSNPKKWLHAHNMGAHNNPQKKEKVA